MEQKQVDILKVVAFAMRYKLPNTGVEAMVRMMQEFSESNALRIDQLPRTWKPLLNSAMEGVDVSSYKKYSYPVPPELGLRMTSVPFVMRTPQDVIEDLLTDPTLMEGDNFWLSSEAGSSLNSPYSMHCLLSSSHL